MAEHPSPREIQQTVVEQYGARARRILESEGLSPAADACCTPAASAPDLITLTTNVASQAEEACCGPDCCSEGAGERPDASQRYGSAGYPEADLSVLPETVVAASAGCGNPLAIAELREGERVLDLGSGGGIDCFLAAQHVGPTGAVWGLDMTPDMVALARHNAAKVGLDNVRFRLGEIENIPFADGAFDVIMSNCVINLSHDKAAVFREAYRVLAPGGRLRVSDMVWIGEAPDTASRAQLESWAGCIAGALSADDYLAAIRAAGFDEVSAEYEGEPGQVTSATVFATKAA